MRLWIRIGDLSGNAWLWRTIGLLLVLGLLGLGGRSGAGGLAPPEPPEFQQAPQRPDLAGHLPPHTGFLLPPMELPHLTGEEILRHRPTSALPPSFDWRDEGKVTGIRDQGNCGSCYAFGYLAGLESRLLIEGAGTHNLSENNAKECNWRELNNFKYPAGNPWGSCDGGNAHMMTSLFSQKGTVLESCDPYKDSDVGCKATCPYQQTVLDWRLISGDSLPSTEALKQYLHDHGPIITTFYADHKDFRDYDGSYTLDYAAPGPDNDHCVLIVGYSNSLPPVKGSSAPASGWIVKNSWGTGWGDRGYFFMTYGAANIGKWSSFVHDWQAYDSTGDIWYYDDDGWWSSWGCDRTTVWGLAKFIAGEDTNVTRVEFWTTDVTTDVDIYVYDDFDGSAPSSLLATNLDNAFSEAGYHSVVLDSPVPVTRGDDVIAVVKFTNASSKFPAPADPHGRVETERTYLSCAGTSWTDMGQRFDADVAIRLRTGMGVVQGKRAYLPFLAHNRPVLAADATVLQGYPTTNYGHTSDMWTGYDHCETAGKAARSLIRFPTSALGSLPIARATLHIRLENSCDIGERLHQVTAYRVTSDWSETDVTWNNQPSIAEAYGSVSIPSRSWGWYALDVTPLVQGWLAGTYPNHGLMLRSNESPGNDSAQLGFNTKESPGTANDPYIQVVHAGVAGVETIPSRPADRLAPGRCGLMIQDAVAASRSPDNAAAPGFVSRTVCESD